MCAAGGLGGLGKRGLGSRKSNRKGQGKRRRRRGQRGTNLARWSSDWRSIGSERAEKNGSGGVDTGGTGRREGAGQDARQFLHALRQVCRARHAFAPSVERAQKEEEEEEAREAFLCISSSFCARCRPHRAPLLPEQGERACVRVAETTCPLPLAA